jgi:hypothetical protein
LAMRRVLSMLARGIGALRQLGWRGAQKVRRAQPDQEEPAFHIHHRRHKNTRIR